MTKKKPVISIDIDDCLFPFVCEFIKYANKKLKQHKTLLDLNTYYLESIYNIPREQLLELVDSFMLRPKILDILPYDNTNIIQTLLELKKYFKLYIITSRLDIYSSLTELWIKKNFFHIFKKIIYCSTVISVPSHISMINKSEKCLEIGAQYLIDDNPANIVDCYRNGINTILFGNYGWHKELPQDIPTLKAKNWLEVKNLIPIMLENIK